MNSQWCTFRLAGIEFCQACSEISRGDSGQEEANRINKKAGFNRRQAVDEAIAKLGHTLQLAQVSDE